MRQRRREDTTLLRSCHTSRYSLKDICVVGVQPGDFLHAAASSLHVSVGRAESAGVSAAACPLQRIKPVRRAACSGGASHYLRREE